MAKFRMLRRITLAGASAATMYLFDPESGRRRRARLRDQLSAKLRRERRKLERTVRYAEGKAAGIEARLEGAGVPHPADDRVLENEIKAVLHRLDFPTSDVTVEVVEGRVSLRGQLRHPEEI